jgi:protein gp37
MTDPNVIPQNLVDKGQWWEVSRNPIFGCTKCSPGCVNCWAEKQAMRLKRMGRSEYKYIVDDKGWACGVMFDRARLKKPIPGKNKVVFMCDMADLFHPDVYDDRISEIIGFGIDQPRHKFIFCTKRTRQMADFFNHYPYFIGTLPSCEHIMGIVTVCNQEEVVKIPLLLECPWAKKGLSLEPLLGPIDVTPYLKDIDWVVVGAETGPKRRVCDPDWIRSVVAQCEEADVPLFVKAYPLPNGKISKNMCEWPEDVRCRQLPWEGAE